LPDLLTVEDIMLAMVLAAVFTWVANRLIEFVQGSGAGALSPGYNVKDMEKVLQKCYDLFPKDILLFGGETYRRGMKVRILTSQNKIFEGKFLGLNNDNMICLMTRRFIVAHAVKNIEEIEIMD